MIRKICVRIGYFVALLFSQGSKWQEICSLVKQAQTAETFTVTCKIHRQAIREGRVVLRVSGRLAGDNVDTLRTLMEQERSVVTLDLEDVRLVDGDAVKLLAIHESNGLRLDNCPLYIREWIRRESETT